MHQIASFIHRNDRVNAATNRLKLSSPTLAPSLALSFLKSRNFLTTQCRRCIRNMRERCKHKKQRGLIKLSRREINTDSCRGKHRRTHKGKKREREIEATSAAISSVLFFFDFVGLVSSVCIMHTIRSQNSCQNF